MNLDEIYQSLTDVERLILLSCFGIPKKHVWVSKCGPGPRKILTGEEISKAGMSPLLNLLQKKLVRNLALSAPNDPFRINAVPGGGNEFVTTLKGNLMVLEILQSEYGYDAQPDWLEQA